MHIWICEQGLVKDGRCDWPPLESEWHEPLLPSPRSISLVAALKHVCLEAFSGTTLAVPNIIWCLQAPCGITRPEALGSDVLESGICHLIPSPDFYLLEDMIFHLKMPAETIHSTGLVDAVSSSGVQRGWSLRTDLIIPFAPYCISHSVPKYFWSYFLPTSHMFLWHRYLNMYSFMGSQDTSGWKGPCEV